jgi:hypothetical protein
MQLWWGPPSRKGQMDRLYADTSFDDLTYGVVRPKVPIETKSDTE